MSLNLNKWPYVLELFIKEPKRIISNRLWMKINMLWRTGIFMIQISCKFITEHTSVHIFISLNDFLLWFAAIVCYRYSSDQISTRFEVRHYQSNNKHNIFQKISSIKFRIQQLIVLSEYNSMTGITEEYNWRQEKTTV